MKRITYNVTVHVDVPQSYVVEVKAESRRAAEDAVEANWESVFQARARQVGYSPARIVHVTAAAKE